MKKFFIKTISLLLGMSFALAIMGCGETGGNTDISFTYSGSTDILKVFGTMVDEFNDTVGKEKADSREFSLKDFRPKADRMSSQYSTRHLR